MYPLQTCTRMGAAMRVILVVLAMALLGLSNGPAFGNQFSFNDKSLTFVRGGVESSTVRFNGYAVVEYGVAIHPDVSHANKNPYEHPFPGVGNFSGIHRNRLLFAGENNSVCPIKRHATTRTLGKFRDEFCRRRNKGSGAYLYMKFNAEGRSFPNIFQIGLGGQSQRTVVISDSERRPFFHLEPRSLLAVHNLTSANSSVGGFPVSIESISQKIDRLEAYPGSRRSKYHHQPLRIAISPRIELANSGYKFTDIIIVVVGWLAFVVLGYAMADSAAGNDRQKNNRKNASNSH